MVLRKSLIVAIAFLGVAAGSSAAHPTGISHLSYGESYSARVPNSLRTLAFNEGYFYTHGPVLIFAYAHPCVYTIRDPAAPDPPVASGEVPTGFHYSEANLPAGFYYISVTQEAGVLVGVSDTRKCNGYYDYRSTGEAYGDHPEAMEWYFRATDGCDNRVYIFSPGGASNGYTCNNTVCFDHDGITFSIASFNDYTMWSPGNIRGYMTVQSGNPVMVLTRDGPGYFVPPYISHTSEYDVFETAQSGYEFVNIHSFADGTEVLAYSLGGVMPQLIWSGTLNQGETHTLEYLSAGWRVVQVGTSKGQASVSVLGGNLLEKNDNYMSYVLDPAGNMQGCDFITRSHTGGFIYVTGLEDGTTVEVRDAATGALQNAFPLNQAQLLNVNFGDGIWRIRSDKEITVCVGKGLGGTFIPLTRNTSGSTPFPPVIAGLTWRPLYPRTSDSTLTVRWLTDELTTTKLNYRFGAAGSVQVTETTGYRTEHQRFIDISGLTEETVLYLWPEATDQSRSTTVGETESVTIRKDAPDLDVSLGTVQDNGSHYTLQFRIENNGDGRANNVKVDLEFSGMQPFSDGVLSDYSEVVNNRIRPTLTVDSIDAHSAIFKYLNVKPYLSHTGAVTYALEGCWSETEDDFGHPYYKTHSSVTRVWSATTIESPMANTRYVILANLRRFFDVNSETCPCAQNMPRKMAAFAVERTAVLAYISSGDPYVIEDYIEHRFHGKINYTWFNSGYLLLVGCSQVMPAFGWNLNCTSESSRVRMCDNSYANVDNDGHFSPELCIGRITGNHPSHYVALFERALSPISFEKAISISGTGNGESSFAGNAAECKDRLDDRYPQTPPYFRLSDYVEEDRLNVYVDNVDNVDFLFYRDHGSVQGWDACYTWDLPSLSFGGKFPIVYSNCCLTGQIQTGGNFAEEFIAHSAAAFIGATKVSWRSVNNKMGRKFTEQHRLGNSIGMSLRSAKRSLANDISDQTYCYEKLYLKDNILMYNIYGDPSRGYYEPGSKPGAAEVSYDPPTTPVSIILPMYEVETGIDGFDHVTIPDEKHGDELIVVDEPIVPVYRWTATYAPGTRVQDVTLVSRGGESHESGLILPTAWGLEKTPPESGGDPSPGVFPTADFHWNGNELPDGGFELALTIYPFFYSAETQDATYYQDYQFELDFVTSTCSITGVTPQYDAVPLGSNQSITVTVTNSGAVAETVDIIVDVAELSSGESVSSLVVSNVSIEPGKSRSGMVIWNTGGHVPTHYQLVVRVEDADTGDEYDVSYARFRLGVPDVATTDFWFPTNPPGFVGDAEDVYAGMQVRSTGDVPLSATIYIQIQHTSDGTIVWQREEGREELLPMQTFTCSDVWNSTGIPPGSYQFIGWVEHDGGATPRNTISFRTLEDMDFLWSTPRDTYRRGDKIMATGNLYRPDGGALGLADDVGLQVWLPGWSGFFGPPLEEHPFFPNYSTSFIVTAASPTGPYGLVAGATKTGYRYAPAGRWLVITDSPFGMTADPPVCPADGVSSITVTSDVVYEGGSPVPDGRLMTVIPWPTDAPIVTEDAAPGVAYTQIGASGGRYQFEWQSPTATVLNAFVAGALVGLDPGRPMTGLSVIFKAVDFNDNRRVDVFDILFVKSSEGSVSDTPAFDRRKDMNENRIIDPDDTSVIVDRWGLEFADAIHCSTCAPDPAPFGVTLRPVPSRASVSPGGELNIDIVADGLDNLEGFEFGSVLSGDSFVWCAAPYATAALESTGNTQTLLGPAAYDDGYRLGAFAGGGNAGPGGTQILAKVCIRANALGESRLILSAPVFARTDASEQSVMRAVEGTYRVEYPTSTPTITPTPVYTNTPTVTPTRTVTPTPSATPISGDLNGDGLVNSDDIFYFSTFWYESTNVADPACNMFEQDEIIDEKDLLLLIEGCIENATASF